MFPQRRPLPRWQASELDALIEPLVSAAGLVGCAVAVVSDGRLVYRREYGMADVEAGRPIAPETSFRIGSTAKLFTAIGIMQLRDKGTLQLDRPVTDYLTAYSWKPPNGAPVATIRQMLTHTSGVGDLLSWSDLAKPLAGLGLRRGTDARSWRMADRYPKGISPDIPPGEKWSYSNHAVATLGQVIEDLTGTPFAVYMREKVFDPLGMSHTDFLRGDRVRELAVGYRTRNKRSRKLPYWDVAIPPAGSAFSTLDDLASFAGALLRGGSNDAGSVLDAATIQEMFASSWTPDPRLSCQGLIFLLEDLNGHRVVWHDGGVPGFITSVLIAPDDGVAVIVVNNSFVDVSHAIADAVLRRVLAVPQLTGPSAVPIELPTGWLQMVGDYRPGPGLKTNVRNMFAFGGQISIRRRGPHLVASSPWGPISKGVVLRQTDTSAPGLLSATVVDRRSGTCSPMRLAFQPPGAGSPAILAGQWFLPFQFRRVPQWRAVRAIALCLSVSLAAAVLAAVLH